MTRIVLILEGYEEQLLFDIFDEYIDKSKFFVDYINARGYGKIGPYFQNYISLDYYDAIICVYDVDDKVNIKDSPFNEVRNKLKMILGDYKKVNAVSFCTNPNIMQIILLACDKLKNTTLLSTTKSKNTTILAKYWPDLGNKKPYDANDWQLEIIKNSFIYKEKDILDIFKNSKDLQNDYTTLPGSNVIDLLIALKNGDEDYFIKAKKVKNNITNDGGNRNVNTSRKKKN